MSGVKQIVAVIWLLFVATVCGQQSVCFNAPDTGNCRAFLPSFFYNPQIGQCDCFVFGGCNPGGNQFTTLDSCMQTCNVRPTTQTVTSECRRLFNVGSAGSSNSGGVHQNVIQPQESMRLGTSLDRPSGCFVSPEAGTCRAFIPTYYFNPQTGSCDCFAFGGCRPNPNNFATVSECMQTCRVGRAEQFLSNECIRLFGNQASTQQPSTSGQQPSQGQTGSQIDPDFIRQNQNQNLGNQSLGNQNLGNQNLGNQNLGNQNLGNQNIRPDVSATTPPSVFVTNPPIVTPIRTESPRSSSQGSITRLTPVSALIISPSGTQTGQLSIGQPVRITG